MTEIHFPQLRVGIDVGGTFTDIVLSDSEGRVIDTRKVPSTPNEPEKGVLDGLMAIAEAKRSHEFGSYVFDTVYHGTTVGTNALLERKGTETALLINKGFRAVYELRGGTLPIGSDAIDTFYEKVAPLVSQQRTYEVPGRIRRDGVEIEPIDRGTVVLIARRLRDAAINSVCVCLLFSYANPAHELTVRDIFRDEHPECRVSLSSEVLPIVREYDRLCTTVLDAYIGPTVSMYLETLAAQVINARHYSQRLFIMQSNGGLAQVDVARRHPNELLLSGPAAGVVFCSSLTRQLGVTRAVTFDMGGTSTDVSLVSEDMGILGYEEAVRGEVGGHDIRTPMIRIRTIGAGGGTIAQIGADGLLKVGPQSAGALPGPSCYGLGGQKATVTDADLVLGYLPAEIGGGTRRLDQDLAEDALSREIGSRLGMSPRQAALGISRIVNSNMEIAIRLSLNERGLDPRAYSMVALGGAGPVHAAAVAQQVGFTQVIVPNRPGLGCAQGLLQADVVHNYVMSRPCKITECSVDDLRKWFQELESSARIEAEEEGFKRSSLRLYRQVYMHYRRQGYELGVPCGRVLRNGAVEQLRRRFDRQHAKFFGVSAPDETVEIVTIRVTALIRGSAAPMEMISRRDRAGRAQLSVTHTRPVISDDTLIQRQSNVYDREALCAGDILPGGSVVDDRDSTVLIPPAWSGSVDAYGNIILRRDAV